MPSGGGATLCRTAPARRHHPAGEGTPCYARLHECSGSEVLAGARGGVRDLARLWRALGAGVNLEGLAIAAIFVASFTLPLLALGGAGAGKKRRGGGRHRRRTIASSIERAGHSLGCLANRAR